MSDALETARALVERRYKTALLFSLPLIAGVGMLFADGVWDLAFLEPGPILVWIIVGLFVGMVPATLYGRARKAYDREVMRDKMDRLARAMEV